MPKVQPQTRPYRAEDWPALAHLLVKCKNAERADSMPPFVLRLVLTPGSFLAADDLVLQRDTLVWFSDSSQLHAFALADLSVWGLVCLIDPDADIGYETLIDWALERTKNRTEKEKKERVLKCSHVREDNARQISALESCGFRKTGEIGLRMARNLDESIAKPQLPTGFAVRHLIGERDIDPYIDMGNSAFPTGFKREHHVELQQVPEFIAELDLVVEAPNGKFAALCQCYFDPCESGRGKRWEGWTDPIGTHPEFRRRGLARAAVTEGLHRLKKCGVARATLYTVENNTAARCLYESLGYKVLYRIFTYEKKV